MAESAVQLPTACRFQNLCRELASLPARRRVRCDITAGAASRRILRRNTSCRRFALACAASVLVPLNRAQDYSAVCGHELYENVEPPVEIVDGQTVYRDMRPNQTHQYFHFNYNVTTMNQPTEYRKLIINLEPCRGVVYLFVRRTRRCYPDPYSCVKWDPSDPLLGRPWDPSECTWTHFMSEIDGSRDGTPTFFEVPLSSTKYFISVFSLDISAYTLTVLADIGALPRPGGVGKLHAKQTQELAVDLYWDFAYYFPTGQDAVTDTKQYWIYSSMLLEEDNRSNTAVFLRSNKIMNTVCGLHNNTDREYTRVNPAQCMGMPVNDTHMLNMCNVTIDGIIAEKRYVFNVVAESQRGMMMAYAGLVVRTQWSVVRQAADDRTLKVVGGIAGCVMAISIIIYFLMLKLYG